MFNRKAIKHRARQILQLNLWPLIAAYVIAVFIPLVISGGSSGPSSYTTFTNSHIIDGSSNGFSTSMPSNTLLMLSLFLGIFSLIALFISAIISIYTIVASGAFDRMSLKAYDGISVRVSDLLEIKGYWFKLLGLYVWIAIRVVLWSLLFIIPGIIASYRYALAPYLMFDDPSKGINQVIDESSVLMRGYKGELFILDLSFIWWYLLTFFTLGLALLWVGPYYALARAGAYRTIIYQNASRQTQVPVALVD